MARLEAISKALFYPTPIEIVKLIASYVKVSGVGVILDPCAGDGGPIELLADQLKVTSFANELDPGRYEEVAGKVNHAVCGPRELLEVEGEFNVVFDNPPYDRSITGERMEIQHIKLDLKLLAPYGLGIWVVPESILDYDLCSFLCIELLQVIVRRFPMPEYDKFKQVVIFGIKREKPSTYAYSLASDLEFKVQQGVETLAYAELILDYTRTAAPITRFEMALPNSVVVMEELDQYGIDTTATWDALFGIDKSAIVDFKPMLPLRSGHMAFVIAAGIVDGTEVEIDGHRHIIKGSTEKKILTTRQSEAIEAGTKTTVYERQRLAHTLTALNLDDGSIVEFDSLEDIEDFSTFLLEHQETLVDMVEETYPPLFDPSLDMFNWIEDLSAIHAPGLLPGQKPEDSNGLLSAQQVRVAGMATKLLTDKSVVLVGEMGSGKTCLAQAVAALIGKGNWKLVVVCPSQIVHKWKREAEKVLANHGITAHVIGQKRKQADGNDKTRKVAKPVLDVIAAMEEPNPTILVMSYETAKNGPRWEHNFSKHIRKFAKEVEDVITTQVPYFPYEKKEITTRVEYHQQRVLKCPDCGLALTGDLGYLKEEDLGKKKRKCAGCEAPLWAQVPFKYGGRTAIADFLNRHYAGRYNLILDECFPADTKVSTPTGPKRIADIMPSEWVMAFKDGVVVKRRVVRCICKKRANNLVRVMHNSGSFDCTPDHKIYVDGEYIKAGKLTVGQRLSIKGFGLGGIYHSTVLSVTQASSSDKYVYDLEVEDAHNYFANDVLVSNCHHTKGSDSDAGYASTDLIAGAQKVIAMTGTIYSGKASSIFHLMYRLLPRFRLLYEYSDVQRFVDQHGLQETIITSTPQKEWSSAYGYNRESIRIREIPGVSPGMVTMLLPNTAFIKLSDMGIHLPEYTEERLPIMLDDRLDAGMVSLDEIYKEATLLARKGQSGLLSAWLHASLGWLDCPVNEVLETKDKEGEVIAKFEIAGVLENADEILDDPLAKDDALTYLIAEKIAAGRGVGVFFSQVNKRDWMTRMYKILTAEGIYSEVLRRSTCKPDEREAWYRGFVDRCKAHGQPPVLLTNGNLVKEGLDLIELPSLVETGIEYNINNLRQRDRRSLRLTQDQPVDVTFLYYADSHQEIALQLIASKLKAALMVDGNLAEGLAAMDADDGNLMDALMKAVSTRKQIGWDGMQVARASHSKVVLDLPAVEVVQIQETVILKEVKVGKKGKKQVQYSFL